jgi:hypothetical protein
MDRDTFLTLAENTSRQALALLAVKNADYSESDDALANMKEEAREMGLQPMQVWEVYFRKQLRAVRRFVRTNKLESEPIEERFQDIINFCHLGYALAIDEGFIDLPAVCRGKELVK